MPKILAFMGFLFFIAITSLIYTKIGNWLEYLAGWGILIAGIFAMSRVAKENIANIITKAKSLVEGKK